MHSANVVTTRLLAARRPLLAIAAAPLPTALATISIAITLAIAVGTLQEHRLAPGAPFALICAAVLAAAAISEGSRAARRDRARRRLTRARNLV